jgi:hypothetical protein
MIFRASQDGNISARQFIHDAFVSDIRAIDYAELANGAGVQYTARGSDNCTMSHCDKGKIQQVLSNIKAVNKTAWAWAMWAYAPAGAENANTLVNILFSHAMGAATKSHLDAIGKKSAFESMECGKLARIAIEHSKIEANTRQRVRHNRVEAASLLRVSAEDYRKLYLRIFISMKDVLHDLDAVVLPPVAALVWTLIDKNEGDVMEQRNAIGDLQKRMKTDVRLAAA